MTTIPDQWRRCGWTLSMAICFSSFLLWICGCCLEQVPSKQDPKPVSVELSLLDEPASRPVPQPAVPRQVASRKMPIPQPHGQEQKTSTVSTPAKPAEQVAIPVSKAVTDKLTSAIPASHESVGNSSNSQHQNSGARAMIQPRPQIPLDLRQEVLNTSCTARFHIAADGRTRVELIKPSSSPRLNRLLLDTLSEWQFFPAMKDGQPIASTEDIVFKVDVH